MIVKSMVATARSRDAAFATSRPVFASWNARRDAHRRLTRATDRLPCSTVLAHAVSRLARLSLALWVVLALSAPALVHPCAAHAPARDASATTAHQHHGQHAAPDDDQGAAPCTCPGECSIAPAITLGAVPPLLVAATIPLAPAPHLPPALVASRQASPYAIPWAQAPPAGSSSV